MSELEELVRKAMGASTGSKEFLEWYATGSGMSHGLAIHMTYLPKARSLTVTIGRPSFGFSKDSQVASIWTRNFRDGTDPVAASKEVEEAVLWAVASAIMNS